MVLRRRAAAALVLFCCVVLPASDAQGTYSCQDGWQLFEGSCYRRTASELRHDQLPDTCRQLGAAPVSIHNAQENNHVARVAGGRYVWIGMKMTGRNQYSWEDGTSTSYKKFLPSGNSMLKKPFVGAGIMQQSCRRWNYERVSRQLHGVCKRPAFRCPEGALRQAGDCYIVASQPAPWWEASMVCYETDRHAVAAAINVQDSRLKRAITDHFGSYTKLIIGNYFTGGVKTLNSCSWSTLQYGREASSSCEFGCAEILRVLCKRPVITVGAEPAEPIKMMPPMYREATSEADATAAPSQSECPPRWSSRGKRCVSEPTEPATRVWADALCQNQNSSRLATIRHENSQPILALQLRGVHEAWVRDERPEAQSAALRQPEYTVLTADGQVMSKPAAEQLPAICEHCQVSCGAGATAFAGHCYRLLEEDRYRDDAASACATLGGAMVSIESKAENRFVAALAFPSSSAQCSQPDGAVWLGLQRLGVAYSWEWDDCSQFSIDVWAVGAGRTGQCATLSRDGLWTDTAQCRQLRLPAVCEWDACEEPGQYGGSCLPLNQGAIY